MSETNETVDTTGQADTGSSDTTANAQQDTSTETPPASEGGIMNADPDKTKEPPPEPEKKAPEEYAAFTYPEGYKPDTKSEEGLKALAKKHGLSQETVQELVSFYTGTEIEQRTESKAAQDQAEKDMIDSWVMEAKKHPEFGGSKFDESVKLADRVVNKFGNEGFKKILAESKFSNNPHFFEFLNNIAKVISDDVLVKGDKATGEKQYNSYTDIFPQPPIEGVT
jgi:hypothetical protein